MTRRERLERKLELRQDWADKAKARSAALSKQSHEMMSVIPMGQPILIGHHSEKRDRNYRDRAWNKMGKAVEQGKLAEHHASCADGIERALDNSIFSDDSDAVTALEQRIAEREAERERMRTVNKLWRKKDAAGLAALGLDLEELNKKLAAAGPYWGKQPHMPYELSNLGGRITADRKRLEAVKVRQKRAAAAEASPTGITLEDCSGGYVRVIFAEKPAREVLNALKAAGFWWSSGSWAGKAEKLPEEVKATARHKKRLHPDFPIQSAGVFARHDGGACENSFQEPGEAGKELSGLPLWPHRSDHKLYRACTSDAKNTS